MRIWSVHPKYLDARGLVALWRESLLAKQVLKGITKGYKNHPQLNRFKSEINPNECINQYLSSVYEEADKRKYNFNKDKICWNFNQISLPVTRGQMEYEKNHLLKKLKIRDFKKYQSLNALLKFEPHPLFNVIPGELSDWEIVQ